MDIQFYEECDDMDSASQLIEELESDYPAEEGWTTEYTLDIRHDCVHVSFEASR